MKWKAYPSKRRKTKAVGKGNTTVGIELLRKDKHVGHILNSMMELLVDSGNTTAARTEQTLR